MYMKQRRRRKGGFKSRMSMSCWLMEPMQGLQPSIRNRVTGAWPLGLPSSLGPVLPASFSPPETVASGPSGRRPESQLPWPQGGVSLPVSLYPGLPPLPAAPGTGPWP